MRLKARAMNVSMWSSNVVHIPDQIAWNAIKRGVLACHMDEECVLLPAVLGVP